MTKKTKSEVDYSPAGRYPERCGRCTHYIDPERPGGDGKCELVAGSINPQYWCKLFKAE